MKVGDKVMVNSMHQMRLIDVEVVLIEGEQFVGRYHLPEHGLVIDAFQIERIATPEQIARNERHTLMASIADALADLTNESLRRVQNLINELRGQA